MASITVGELYRIIEGADQAGLSVEPYVRAKLLEIYPDINLPCKLGNTIRKVRTCFTKGQLEKLVFEESSPPHSYIGPFCKEAGIDEEVLLSDSKLICDGTNGIVFELERERRLRKLPGSFAVSLTRRIWGDKCDSVHPESLKSAWSKVYTTVTEKKRRGSNIEEYLNSPFCLPSARTTTPTAAIKKITGVHIEPKDPPLKQAMVLGSALGKCMLLLDNERGTTQMLQQEHAMLQREHAKEITELKFKVKETERSKMTAEEEIEKEKKKSAQLASTLKSVQTTYAPRNCKRRLETKARQLEKKDNIIRQKDAVVSEKEATIVELNATIEQNSEQIRDLQSKMEREKSKKVQEQKKVSALKKKLKIPSESEIVRTLKETVNLLENQNEELKEQMDEFLNSNEIKTFEGGAYSDTIREVYMSLLSQNVSIRNCETVVRTVLSKLCNQKTIERLPKKSLASKMMAEAEVLAKLQAGKAMLESNNNTLHIDGTTKSFKEFASLDVTTGEGEGLSLGFQEMASGSADSYMEVTRDLLRDLASLMTEEGAGSLENDKMVTKIIFSCKNTQSDRHIVNKSYNDQLIQFRENLLPLLRDDLEDLTPNEIDGIVRMNHLFCGLHVLSGLASVAKDALQEFENLATEGEVVSSGFQRKEARACSILYEASKALCPAHNYQKAGAVAYWVPFLEERGLKNRIPSFKGERINIIFVAGAAVYSHRNDIKDFLINCPQTNKLLTALGDIQQPLFQAELRALGIMNKLVTGPLFRLVESSDNHIFSLNETWKKTRDDLQKYSLDARPLLEGIEIVPNGTISKDEMYEELFREPDNPDVAVLTEECLRLLAAAFTVLIDRQLADQLPGGRFYSPSPEIMEQTSSAPLHNMITERDFAHLDRKLREKPNISGVALSGVILFLNNKTSKWLETLPETEKKELMKKARQHAPLFQKKCSERRQQIMKKKKEVMAEKRKKKENMENKKLEIKEGLSMDIAKHGGLWQSEEQMNIHLQSVSNEQERLETLKTQIKYRKQVLGTKVSNKELLQLSAKGKTFSTKDLEKNLGKVLQELPQNDALPTQPTGSSPGMKIVADRSEAISGVVRRKLSAGESSSASGHSTSKAKKRKLEKLPDFSGKSIHHRWKEENGLERWYFGRVTKVLGDTKDPNCLFEVVYDVEGSEAEAYEVELYEDYSNRDVVIVV